MSSPTMFKPNYNLESASSEPQQHSPINISKQPLTSRRRKSSFTTSSSPYARRRSFLSKAMLENDDFQIYELSSFSPSSCFISVDSPSRARIPSFSINLTQSQGFIWNQDLFASSYQQARAGIDPDEFQEGSASVEVVDIVLEEDSDPESKPVPGDSSANPVQPEHTGWLSPPQIPQVDRRVENITTKTSSGKKFHNQLNVMLRLLGSALPRMSRRLASTCAVARPVTMVPPAPLAGFKFISPVLAGLSQSTEMVLSSVVRKRRLKMKKHKLRKRRKAQRALRIKHAAWGNNTGADHGIQSSTNTEQFPSFSSVAAQAQQPQPQPADVVDLQQQISQTQAVLNAIQQANRNKANSGVNGDGLGEFALSDMDKYGLNALLPVLKMQNNELNTITTGLDLNMLGLDMTRKNENVQISKTFASPWLETSRSEVEPIFSVPKSFEIKNDELASVESRISTFNDETLFFIFYSKPRDVLQELVARELNSRNWRYHKDLQVWLTKDSNVEPTVNGPASENGTYVFFDPTSWEYVTKDFVLYYQSII
ncbi:hypothetical protein OGAPHI_006635 [Ogataea philodendri]|uniref:Ribosomal protein mS38 C-terminal domain-containing protein n=1 Tax=Ogataea philodendri TaxID=1378263 RepID=A0A9P8NWM9_9ASCO|nr:uncharacterized protein OGAPHI_006635 [Ogataea philodendri]KAH3661228.1 hypothetical protein OGAPHI_006635 [Ogataea philodendri]